MIKHASASHSECVCWCGCVCLFVRLVSICRHYPMTALAIRSQYQSIARTHARTVCLGTHARNQHSTYRIRPTSTRVFRLGRTVGVGARGECAREELGGAWVIQLKVCSISSLRTANSRTTFRWTSYVVCGVCGAMCVCVCVRQRMCSI